MGVHSFTRAALFIWLPCLSARLESWCVSHSDPSASNSPEKATSKSLGSETRQRYRIYGGASQNVCKVNERGRPGTFVLHATGSLPIGHVMLAKIASEIREDEVAPWAKCSFQAARPLL